MRLRLGSGERRGQALVAGVLLACGGHTSHDAQEREVSGAGTGGAASSAGATASAGAVGGAAAHAGTMTGGSGAVAPPNTVTFFGPSGEVQGSATPSTIGPCFRGFAGMVNGMWLELEAFVQAPGDYEGDSLHILYLAARLADGRTFSASTNNAPFGEIHLHATAVSPRFVGSVKATLYDGDDPGAQSLMLSLAFDVAASESCVL